MSKKHSRKNGKSASKGVAKKATAVRNTAVPKKSRPVQPLAAKPRTAPTYEQIALKAYFISISPQCGSETDNWLRAERELRGA